MACPYPYKLIHLSPFLREAFICKKKVINMENPALPMCREYTILNSVFMSLLDIPRLRDQSVQGNGNTVRGTKESEYSEILPFFQDISNLSIEKRGRHH